MRAPENLTASSLAQRSVKWFEVPPANLAGQGLAAYPPGDFAGLFDWSERDDTSSVHVMPYAGQFLIDVVEIEDNAVHQPSKPTNEIVCVLNGFLELLGDGAASPQRFGAGEMVLIPGGWAGQYRVISSDTGWFRELCIVPANYFDPATIPAPSGLPSVSIARLSGAGEHTYAHEPYSIRLEKLDQSKRWSIDAAADQIVRILEGTLTLTADGEVETFLAGAFVVLPKGFVGQAEASAGYQALVAGWGG